MSEPADANPDFLADLLKFFAEGFLLVSFFLTHLYDWNFFRSDGVEVLTLVDIALELRRGLIQLASLLRRWAIE
jgi:hypothetical protein